MRRNPRWEQLIAKLQQTISTLSVVNIIVCWLTQEPRYILLNLGLVAMIMPVMIYDLFKTTQRGESWTEQALRP